MLTVEEINDVIENVQNPALKQSLLPLGMMVDQGEDFLWRGPMVGKTIHQLLEQVLWGELDYRVVDLPPGTGDPYLTVAQMNPKDGVLMVTTP
jgi:ATP-binding protein involved in chromosome partitioning